MFGISLQIYFMSVLSCREFVDVDEEKIVFSLDILVWRYKHNVSPNSIVSG